MFSKAILLFVAVPLSLAQETPLVRILPEKSFTASSSYNDSVKAPNVRFARGMFVSSASKEPWCPATREDYDYEKEFVIADLGCPQTVHRVEGKDPHALFYSGEYSNNKKKWKILASEDETYYDKNMKMFEANNQALITPPVRARFFKFRIPIYSYSDERGSQPCIKVELYGSPDLEDSVQPIGCFTETKKKRLLPDVYHTVKGRVDKKYPDILAVYEECKQKAAENSKPIEIFGVWNFKQCVTTKTGKGHEYFKNARNSGKCKACQDKGIGTSKAVFVYKK